MTNQTTGLGPATDERAPVERRPGAETNKLYWNRSLLAASAGPRGTLQSRAIGGSLEAVNPEGGHRGLEELLRARGELKECRLFGGRSLLALHGGCADFLLSSSASKRIRDELETYIKEL